MSRMTMVVRKPIFMLLITLPLALIGEFILLEGLAGVSFPPDRGSAVSTYVINTRGTGLHFVTRNKRFIIADLYKEHGSAIETLVLRESIDTDRQDGREGQWSMLKVEALDQKSVRWSFDEPGDQGQVIDSIYEVVKFGCCGSPNTYTYFSLRDGKKLRTLHRKINSTELEELLQSLAD